jgi:uncharacterized protein (DUF58 family)
MLDPRVLSSIADLELVARVTVDGTIAGLHRSPFHGYSAEFSQYRHYQPGDDLKYVDWKLFARTDRVYTKQYRETTNLPVQLVLDASGSMGFAGTNGVGKLAFARVLAAALAHLGSRQGDAVGLAVAGADLRRYVPGRSGATHLRRLLLALTGIDPSGPDLAPSAFRRAVDLLKRRGLLIVLSDLYDDGPEMEREIRRASQMGHEIALFHVLTRDEIDFPYRGDVRFDDLETGASVVTSSSAIAPSYRSALRTFLDGWRSRAARLGIDYGLGMTDAAPDEVLRTYLLKRAAGPR